MKMTVTYYDIETDRAVTKKCVSFEYNPKDSSFYFLPVDEPVTIYKTRVISHPIVYMNALDDRAVIRVVGYVQSRLGGMTKTETVITIEK